MSSRREWSHSRSRCQSRVMRDQASGVGFAWRRIWRPEGPFILSARAIGPGGDRFEIPFGPTGQPFGSHGSKATQWNRMVSPSGLSLFCRTTFQGRWPWLDEPLALWAVLLRTAAIPVPGGCPLFPDTCHSTPTPRTSPN